MGRPHLLWLASAIAMCHCSIVASGCKVDPLLPCGAGQAVQLRRHTLRCTEASLRSFSSPPTNGMPLISVDKSEEGHHKLRGLFQTAWGDFVLRHKRGPGGKMALALQQRNTPASPRDVHNLVGEDDCAGLKPAAGLPWIDWESSTCLKKVEKEGGGGEDEGGDDGWARGVWGNNWGGWRDYGAPQGFTKDLGVCEVGDGCTFVVVVEEVVRWGTEDGEKTCADMQANKWEFYEAPKGETDRSHTKNCCCHEVSSLFMGLGCSACYRERRLSGDTATFSEFCRGKREEAEAEDGSVHHVHSRHPPSSGLMGWLRGGRR